MIWFDIKKLEEKISRNELSERDGFNYLLAFFILSGITMGSNSGIENTGVQLVNCILLVLISIWGLNKAYKANVEIDGKDFFKRFFAVNWVIGIRMLCVLLSVIVIIGVVTGIISHENSTTLIDRKQPFEDIVMTIFSAMLEVIFYLLVINSIRRIKPITE